VPTGSVLNKINNRGFTFIAVDPEYEVDDNVFLHVTAIQDRDHVDLFARGSRVEFEIVFVSRDGQGRPQARNARPVAETADTGISTSSVGEKRGSVKFRHPMGYGFLVDEKGGHECYAKVTSVPGWVSSLRGFRRV